MMPGLEWREQDGKRYLRMDYTAHQELAPRIAMHREVEQEFLAAGPGQRFITVLTGLSVPELGELLRDALVSYRKVHHPGRSVIGVVGHQRGTIGMLRSFNVLGARGRIAGFSAEPEAVDWLLSH